MKKRNLLILAMCLLSNGGCTKVETVVENRTITNYKIVFETNGGSKVEDIIYNEGDTITLPENPTKGNIDFVGWYLNKGLTKPFELPEKMPAESYKVYAKFSPKITFNSNGGTEVESRYVTAGAIVSKPESPTKENFYFGGWYADAEFTEGLPMFMPNENITAYAKWIDPSDPNSKQNLLDKWEVNDAGSFDVTNESNGSLKVVCHPEKGTYSYIRRGYGDAVVSYCSTVSITISGEVGANVLVKFNNKNTMETNCVLEQETQTFTWTLNEQIDSNIALIVFPYGGKTLEEDKTIIISEFNLL